MFATTPLVAILIHKDGLAPFEALIAGVADVRGFACKAVKTVNADENRVKAVTQNNEHVKIVFFLLEENGFQVFVVFFCKRLRTIFINVHSLRCFASEAADTGHLRKEHMLENTRISYSRIGLERKTAWRL